MATMRREEELEYLNIPASYTVIPEIFDNADFSLTQSTNKTNKASADAFKQGQEKASLYLLLL